MNVTDPLRRRTSWRGHPGRMLLVAGVATATLLLIMAPLAAVFHYALREGFAAYVGYLTEPSTLHAIGLTLLAAAIAVPFNTVFGIAAAWAVARFDFPGRKLVTSLIELPLSISPIILGVAYLFVFGMQGLFGPWLMDRGLRLVFSVPAVIIMTTIVTLPYVFREVLPLLQARGAQDEEAAVTLGARGWQVFTRVTLPNMKWALFYGVSLTLARCLGEFGSVAVVSGSVRGETNTMTLQIELLAQDRTLTGAFAVASLLSSIAVITMLVKVFVERREAARRVIEE